jgi:hypothetical protein
MASPANYTGDLNLQKRNEAMLHKLLYEARKYLLPKSNKVLMRKEISLKEKMEKS